MPTSDFPVRDPGKAVTRDRLVKIFFFATFGFLLIQLFLLAEPFMPALLGGSMLAMAFYPVYHRLLRSLRKSSLSAFVMTVGVFLLAVLPLACMAWFVMREIGRLLPAVQDLLERGQHIDLVVLSERLPGF